MADDEQLTILRQGVEVWNAWRRANPSIEVNLVSANLGDADLGGANLMEAKLRRAYLVGANLSEAYLESAKLRGAVLAAGLRRMISKSAQRLGTGSIKRSGPGIRFS